MFTASLAAKARSLAARLGLRRPCDSYHVLDCSNLAAHSERGTDVRAAVPHDPRKPREERARYALSVSADRWTRASDRAFGGTSEVDVTVEKDGEFGANVRETALRFAESQPPV